MKKSSLLYCIMLIGGLTSGCAGTGKSDAQKEADSLYTADSLEFIEDIRAAEMRRDSMLRDSLQRDSIYKAETFLASDIAFGGVDPELAMSYGCVNLDSQVLKKRGFHKNGNAWVRVRPTGNLKIVSEGEAIDETITVSFGNAEEMTAFVKSLPKAGFKPMGTNLYGTGQSDVDMYAHIKGNTVVFSY